jgi:hypothetical protein
VPTTTKSISLLLPHRSTAEARHFESSPMPPRRSSSSYRGVRTRATGNFCVDICVASYHLTLRTFKTAHEATRTYNTAAWRLGRPRRDLNFHGVNSAAQVEMPVDEGIPNGPSIFAYLVFGPGETYVEGIARPMKLIVWRGPGATLGVQCKI